MRCTLSAPSGGVLTRKEHRANPGLSQDFIEFRDHAVLGGDSLPRRLVGNVILPVYGGIEIARAVLGPGGFFERLYIGDDWIRHFVAGGACLCVSGLMRLMEHFIAAGTAGVA